MNFQLTSSNDWNEYLADWYKIEINPGWDTLNGVFKSCLSCITLECKSEDMPDFEGMSWFHLSWRKSKYDFLTKQGLFQAFWF